MDQAAARYRLGVDVGGTHTDLVLLDTTTGSLLVEKVASTPKNPALGVMNGVARFFAQGVQPDEIGFFGHGTTITTNALLEMRGAKTGLLITKGYRAVQEVQNQARDGNPFDYFYSKPRALAPQNLTKEIGERSDYQGRVLLPLMGDDVRRAARELKAAGVESIAVCYLFSYANPRHEQETRALIHAEFPGVSVSLSSDVLPRIREWPRLSSTLLNAYLEPVLVRYIAHLNKGLDDTGVTTGQRFLMQSNGGVMPFSATIEGGRTVHTLFSGPAAGAQASAHLAREEAQRGLVTLDMGGTSADIAFIEGGAPLEVTEGTISRRQLDVPALDMTSISAGGGSMARVDGGGFLMVGPESAGADPGPACYGRGGTHPAVTDADLVCGFLNPDYFLGGAQKLDASAAHSALKTHIADPLRMSVCEAAAGIRRIVDMRMADEIRVFAAKRGIDLSAFTLLPFGGAGAVHAAAVAEELGMQRILVPARPGAFSALGLLCTDVVHDYIRSDLKPLAEITPEYAESIFEQLTSRALHELAAERLNAAEAVFTRELDLRYAGQGYELRISLEGLYRGALNAGSLAKLRTRFDERHAQVHGHAAKERPVEAVSYRLRVRVSVLKYQVTEEATPPNAPPLAGARKGLRSVYFDDATAIETVLYERDRLHVGATLTGPAIIEQFDATTVVPPGWTARVDGARNLILEVGEAVMDAITVQILRNKIASLTDEMHYHFYRSGYSTIIRESRDFSCVIVDRNGRLITAPPMFFHAPVYRHLVGNILKTYTGNIGDGDVFVSNHPYDGGLPHVSDMAFVAPIFAGSELVGFSGSIAHKADIGGAVAGSTSANATEMYHEGLLIPPIKIWDAGIFLPDIERIILTNSRQPELVRGDMNAQIAVTQMGAARVKELCARFSTNTVTDAFAAILAGAAEQLRQAIRALSEGEASAEGWLDSDGVEVDKPVKLAVTISVKDGLTTFDFSNSGPQARGPINLRPSMIEACVFYCLIGCLDPKLQFNDGMRDCVRMVLAPRTVTNAEPPAPVSNYQMVNLKLVDVILEAMAHFNPARAVANAGSSSALSISWKKARPGQSTMQYEIIGSAYGGGAGHDGSTGTATHLSNLHITPIEILESEYPCRVTRFDIVPDSGGAGRWRGGASLVREYELLEDATVIRRFDKAKFPPRGLAGGEDGARARFIVGFGTPEEREILASGRFEMNAGAKFLLQTAGGGGYGPPADRDKAAIAQDIAEGFVSRDQATKTRGAM